MKRATAEDVYKKAAKAYNARLQHSDSKSFLSTAKYSKKVLAGYSTRQLEEMIRKYSAYKSMKDFERVPNQKFDVTRAELNEYERVLTQRKRTTTKQLKALEAELKATTSPQRIIEIGFELQKLKSMKTFGIDDIKTRQGFEYRHQANVAYVRPVGYYNSTDLHSRLEGLLNSIERVEFYDNTRNYLELKYQLQQLSDKRLTELFHTYPNIETDLATLYEVLRQDNLGMGDADSRAFAVVDSLADWFGYSMSDWM